MELLPEWAPNLHPMVVHVPIGILIAAIGADVVALVLRQWYESRPDGPGGVASGLRPVTVALYVAGGASLIGAYLTGTWAADVVSVPAAAEAVFSEHADLGWWTMWFFCVYALLRLALYLLSKTKGRRAVHALLLLLAVGGAYLLYETGEHGAEMVFRHGVGVQQMEARAGSGEPGLTIGDAGWQWQPQADTAWMDHMTWLEGGPTDVEVVLDTTDMGRVVLALRPAAPIAFVVPDTLGAVQVIAEVNGQAFEGTVALLHHVQGPQSYDYLAIGGTSLRQGRVIDGEHSTFAIDPAKTEGWRTIRAVGDGTHFRGYVDGKMVMHGHGAAAEPGRVGVRLDGTGTYLLRHLSAEALP